MNEPSDKSFDPRGASKGAIRREFAKRLQDAIHAKGWNQSELARRANDAGEERVARDDISTYIRGKSMPGALKARAIAKALGMELNELIPSASSVDRDNPEFEIRQASEGHVWLRVNKRVTWDQAQRVGEIIHEPDDKEAVR